MNKSVFDVIDRDVLRKQVKNTIELLKNDYGNEQMFFDRWGNDSKYHLEILVSQNWGWKAVGRVMDIVYGVTVEDAMFAEVEGMHEDVTEDEYLEIMSQEVEWLDYDLEPDFYNQLQKFMREEGLAGNLCLGFDEGDYCLTLYMDVDDLEG